MRHFNSSILILLSILFFLNLNSCSGRSKKISAFSEEVLIILEANKSSLYSCYKNYILEEPKPKNGKLFIQWKNYGKMARDVYVTKGFAQSVENCLISNIRSMSFSDLFLGNKIHVSRFIFIFSDGRLDIKHQ